MNLSDVIAAIAYKQLTHVDLPGGSNQHEINGSSALRDFFGTGERLEDNIVWYYFADDKEPRRFESSFTFYDAREKNPNRTEWRLYYEADSGELLSRSDPGDILALLRTADDITYGLIFQKDSGWLRAASDLFGIAEGLTDSWQSDTGALSRRDFHHYQTGILDELGIEIAIPSLSNDEDIVLEKFGRKFPPTKVMSAFARSLTEVDLSNPDHAILEWLNREESLFRALENLDVQPRLDKGFEEVADFISYSLSVQNRRKSRRGWSFTNHLAALWDGHHLKYAREKKTEGNQPDFIFPSIDSYHNPEFNAEFLTMLGAKTTLKDRWRQVLPEAERIPQKHLCTLQAGISVKQTDQMRKQQVTLVIPDGLQATFTETQRRDIINLKQFIEMLEDRQQLAGRT